MLLKRIFLVMLLAGVLYACKDKVVEPATETQTNKWILEQMNYWYYWNDKIPASPDMTLEPSAFFTSLLNKYDAATNPDGDRFSWIQESADELTSSLNGNSKTTGMDYKLVYYPRNTTNVVGIVLYTLPNSPASKAGIRRGDVFTSVNDQKLTSTNYSQLLNASGTLSFTFGSITDDGTITEGTTKKSLEKLSIQEDPVYYDTTFQFGANKVAYLVYHHFVRGPDSVKNSVAYDQKLETVFARFKANNVNSLILDLRYNGGGYVSSATNLASLIGKVTTNDVFYYKEYNKTVTPVLEKQYGANFFFEKFQSKPQNIGSSLNNFIILVSGNSASASELVINGLKPFMNVTLVGAKTYGKNVGSITITGEDEGIKWGLQPIVTKSFNSLRKSDYSVGFTPDYAVAEGTKLYPYGNPRDPLLGEALFRIVGSRVVRQSTLQAARTNADVQEIESTVSKKAGGSNMFFDK
ncbi:S41 family peptidase [Dyadobacter psychrotolerans]|uniref:Peptidase S41 n=1 Tax=Dyadobacter psychrotolerans TaxID=2541721 RepID=A0A4V2Z362_9BACT|nr:S41 family peptidase [Dyadobacter psychrotolerans]TDE11538.1 peptidase S41 [Dyadobacter psychrotolerans]